MQSNTSEVYLLSQTAPPVTPAPPSWKSKSVAPSLDARAARTRWSRGDGRSAEQGGLGLPAGSQL
ncbi:hypothetical protein ACPA9J_11920 [Pseudomonas aeruginosa]